MAAQGGGSDKDGGQPASDADLDGRLDRLSRELDVGRRERRAAERPHGRDGQGYGLAFRMASEFVAGILVGAALGWGLDWLAGTSPWGLVGLLLVGFAAGVMNVLRIAGRMTTAAGRDGVKGE